MMIERPLDGDLVSSLKVHNPTRSLAKRRYALELSLYERVMTFDTNKAGVAGYRLFEASGFKTPILPTLAEAIELNPYSQLFLLSLGGAGLCLVTSRFGYDASGPVEIRQPSKSCPEILLYDVQGDVSDEGLEAYHLERMRTAGIDPESPIPQQQADALFRDMASRAPEMP